MYEVWPGHDLCANPLTQPLYCKFYCVLGHATEEREVVRRSHCIAAQGNRGGPYQKEKK